MSKERFVAGSKWQHTQILCFTDSSTNTVRLRVGDDPSSPDDAQSVIGLTRDEAMWLRGSLGVAIADLDD